MTKPRYKVATSHGYTITTVGSSGWRGGGLTASVLDTHIIHREVKRFRSEDRTRERFGFRLGIEGAKRAAQEYADALNAGCSPE
jgi:hypothetical protein